FQIDGEDYYTSGNIAYTGLWVKKGFVFKTRAGQTSMRVTIRNNAPGGGGNDWAIDDIGVATCLPNMKYSPTLTPTVCAGSPLKLTDTIRSYFNNYRFHQWQTSIDGGTTWTNVGPLRDSTAHWNSELNVWEYWSSYISSSTTVADNGRKFRMILATSVGNLSDESCRSVDPMNGVTLSVNDCGGVLAAKLLSFNGAVRSGKTVLKWTATGEDEPIYYDVQKSYDGSNFTTIATVNSYTGSAGDQHSYSYTDPEGLNRKTYYRLNLRTEDNRGIYSRILQMTAQPAAFAFVSVVNPFHRELYFDISAEKGGIAKADLIDNLGKTVRRRSFDIREGVNQLSMDDTNVLPTGIYILRVELSGMVIYKRVMKQGR
ncbi:MAG: T9SS type A sorting domain-containing protein, partial [Chitinophagaceae bacterium]